MSDLSMLTYVNVDIPISSFVQQVHNRIYLLVRNVSFVTGIHD